MDILLIILVMKFFFNPLRKNLSELECGSEGIVVSLVSILDLGGTESEKDLNCFT